MLLTLSGKHTRPVDFEAALLAFVKETYPDLDSSACAEDVCILQNLRHNIVAGMQGDLSLTSKDSLQK